MIGSVNPSKMCSQGLREAGLASPKTCDICGLGPCIRSFAHKEPESLTDADLAATIRQRVAELNKLAERALEREINVLYRVDTKQDKNPVIIVAVVTEVG